METNEFEKGKKFSLKESIVYAENSIVSKHILKDEMGNITLFAFDAGGGLSKHTASCNAFLSIVDGKVEVLIDGDSTMLEAGDFIILPANLSHALNAVQPSKLVLTLFGTKSKPSKK